jgi:uncharacterized membrane protein
LARASEARPLRCDSRVQCAVPRWHAHCSHPGVIDDARHAAGPSAPEVRNVRTIWQIERESQEKRSGLDRVIDGVAGLVGRPIFLALHLGWFAAWITLNRGADAFDPFPFSLLTLIVSLEAIILTGFLLIAQNRMSAQADRRAQLDLQVNLLAEQELTAILRLLSVMAERANIDVAECDPFILQFRASTDVSQLDALLDQAEGNQDPAATAARRT